MNMVKKKKPGVTPQWASNRATESTFVSVRMCESVQVSPCINVFLYILCATFTVAVDGAGVGEGPECVTVNAREPWHFCLWEDRLGVRPWDWSEGLEWGRVGLAVVQTAFMSLTVKSKQNYWKMCTILENVQYSLICPLCPLSVHKR